MKSCAGYEHFRFLAASDPQTAFTDSSGSFLWQGCAACNNTNINNTAFGVNGLGNRVLQIMWTGAKYAVTDDLDVIGAYYHYIQNSFFGTRTGGPAFCSNSSHSQCAGTYDAISAAVDWRFPPNRDLYFGMMFNQVHGGLGFCFFQQTKIDPTG